MTDNHIAGEYTFASDNIGNVHHARVKLMHGADGAATDVSTASPLPVGGAAADDAAAAGNPVSVGGVYQESPDLVDDGDVGRLRMTARRALIMAGEYQKTILTPALLTNATTIIDGIVVSNFHSGKLGSANGAIYGVSTSISIPLLAAGWRNIAIAVNNATPAHDQEISLWLDTGFSADTYGHGNVCEIAVPAIDNLVFTMSTAGAAGYGGEVGGATATWGSFYSVPGLAGSEYVVLYLNAQNAPTIGSFTNIIITRWT